MPDMREGGLGTAACYLTVERLALQAGVESPFWDETSLLMGGCDEPWYKKPLTPRRLRSFLKRYGGSLPDDDGQRGHAASVFADVMRLHGIPMEDGADDLGALYVRRAESVGMTVAFLATGCTLADMAAITGFCEEAIVQRVTRTWDGDTSGRVRFSCSWRTGTRPRRRTRASGATRSMARRCTSKMAASSSTRWQEGHPRGCPSLMESLCGILRYHIYSIVGCYN